MIKKAGTTEKSKTRSAKSDKTRGREAPVDVESGDESDAKYRPSPPLKVSKKAFLNPMIIPFRY